MKEIDEIRAKLIMIADAKIAEHSKRYLKSPYSFYGIRVPVLRKIAKEHKNLDIASTHNLFDELWNSGNHEEMSLAMFLLQNHKKKYGLETWNFIMKRLEKAKTWDHIDWISTDIIGNILLNNITLNPEIKEMSMSQNPWVRRASIVSTYQLIKKQRLDLTFKLAETLVYDSDIYVQKGAGWMLREAGKRQRLAAREFILMHLDMKPTTFSYAIEKMKELRQNRKEWEIKQKEKEAEKII
jgi:3-methyladenine DNA glycosylase AlkD